jgi:hypothetical protein
MGMKRLALIAPLAALVMAAVEYQASAILITSVDRSTFQAAVAGGTIAGQNFDSLSSGTLLGTLNGVSYGASGGTPIVTNSYLTSTTPNGLGSTSVGFFLPSETASFSFSNAITAFAIDVNTFAATNGAYRALLSTGDVVSSLFEVFPSTSTGQFLGFITDTPFTSVQISATTGYSYTLDTLVYGDAAAVGGPTTSVPEPGTMLLLGTGALLLIARRRTKDAAV